VIYLDNIREAKVTDHYTLNGGGTEIWEPRFTYHGFRFVEVRGWPGKPTLGALEGRVVNDDVASAGEFSCSQPMINQIYHNILWGVRGNYRSLPTDCPQRDERQGWMGDRSAESKGETYLFNIAALYAKWTQDMTDVQKASGSIPDVCPPYWSLYNDSVTWPSSAVIGSCGTATRPTWR
jgi:alpha-L-rhamnosidase